MDIERLWRSKYNLFSALAMLIDDRNADIKLAGESIPHGLRASKRRQESHHSICKLKRPS
jgi:hypothetical protein